jgi:rod shape-determining protein MreD
MKRFLLFPVILVLGILQAVVLSRFRIFNSGVDILLVSAVLAGIFFGPRLALPLGLFAGILKDMLSSGPFGINTILFVFFSFLAVKLSRKIIIDDVLRASVVVFILAFLNNIIRGLAAIYLGNVVSMGIYIRIVIMESIFTAGFTPLLFTLTKRWQELE